MIVDRIQRLPLYFGMHPNLDKVILALRGMDLDDMPNGRHEIDGEDVFLNIMDTELKHVTTWEAHRNYIDLQLVLQHEETIAWAPLDQIQGFCDYDPQRDIQLSEGTSQGSPIHLQKGMFGIFFPEDAHQPGLGSGKGRKAVFKIKVIPTASGTAEDAGLLHHKGTVPLKSERLLLRRYQQQDAQQAFDNWCGDPAVSSLLLWDTHPDSRFTQGLIQDWIAAYKNKRSYHWVVEMDGEVIGDIAAMNCSDHLMQCEIGYCLSKRFWGKGIMTEAVIRVMRFLFLEVGFHRIVGRHFVDNPASGRVLQKAGMKQEGITRQYRNAKTGGFEDLAVYAAIRAEWLKEHA